MKVTVWILTGLALVFGMLSALPASVLSLPVERATQGRWSLSAAQGTVWEGEGQWVYHEAQGDVLPMSRMAWQFQPARLLKGRLAWSLLVEGSTGAVDVGWGGWQIEHLHFALPMAALARLSPEWKGAGFGGQLVVTAERFASQSGNLTGALRVDWLAAGSTLTRLAPFGSYGLDIAGNGKGLSLHVGTIEGDLMIEGNGQWQTGSALTLSGVAETRPERFEILKPMLLMLGQPNGGNGVNWQIRAGA